MSKLIDALIIVRNVGTPLVVVVVSVGNIVVVWCERPYVESRLIYHQETIVDQLVLSCLANILWIFSDSITSGSVVGRIFGAASRWFAKPKPSNQTLTCNLHIR